YVNNTVLSLSAPAYCFVWLCIAQHTVKQHTQSNANQHDYTVKQHTVNPLITPHVNPFLPSVSASY
ncbi:unnamed protein product, partial [Staurois parvus]